MYNCSNIYNIYVNNIFISPNYVLLIVMAENKVFRILPYRDTAGKVATEQSAESLVISAFQAAALGASRVREGYWYDLQQAGATAYSGSNQITFSPGSNPYGFPEMIQLAVTVPQSKTWALYGIADYTAEPSLQAWQVKQGDVTYPIIYLSPNIYTNEDHTAILNGPYGAVTQNHALTIILYGTTPTTDNIDILFKVAETAAQA